MSQNAEKAPFGPAPSQKNLAGGEAAATVPQESPQRDGLFPVEPAPLSARPLVLKTRGRVEYLAHCPHCRDWHRHVHLGNVTGPCGVEYELQPKSGRRAA
ncbi:hypothetical protein ABZ742_02865 [Streptomyces albogriseolus]|uniref:hypothetical protein n=1 Tax=Streptomyces albogriseolus TaxID=1887 RepID=UPI003460D754